MKEIDRFGTKELKKEARLLTGSCRFITIQFIFEKFGDEENNHQLNKVGFLVRHRQMIEIRKQVLESKLK